MESEPRKIVIISRPIGFDGTKNLLTLFRYYNYSIFIIDFFFCNNFYVLAFQVMTFLNELIPVDGAEIGDRTNFGSIKGLKSWVFLLNWKLARAYPSLFVIHLNYGWVKTYARKRKVMHLLYIREESWKGGATPPRRPTSLL